MSCIATNRCYWVVPVFIHISWHNCCAKWTKSTNTSMYLHDMTKRPTLLDKQTWCEAQCMYQPLPGIIQNDWCLIHGLFLQVFHQQSLQLWSTLQFVKYLFFRIGWLKNSARLILFSARSMFQFAGSGTSRLSIFWWIDRLWPARFALVPALIESRPASAATRNLWKSVLSDCTTLPVCVVSFTFITVYIVSRLIHCDCFSFVWNTTSLVHNRVRTNSVILSSPCIWAVSIAVLMFSLAMSLVARHVRSGVFVQNTENLRSWSTSFWTSSLSILIFEVPMSLLAEGAYYVSSVVKTDITEASSASPW